MMKHRNTIAATTAVALAVTSGCSSGIVNSARRSEGCRPIYTSKSPDDQLRYDQRFPKGTPIAASVSNPLVGTFESKLEEALIQRKLLPGNWSSGVPSFSSQRILVTIGASAPTMFADKAGWESQAEIEMKADLATLYRGAVDSAFNGTVNAYNASQSESTQLYEKRIGTTVQNAGPSILAAGWTPMAVTGALQGVQSLLDEVIDRVGLTASSTMYSMRGHLAATIADMDVIFADQMDTTIDQLSAERRETLQAVMVMANDAERAMREFQAAGFESASDLLCQTTVNFANYPNTVIGLGLPLERCFAPDVLCQKPIVVRDGGSTRTEQLIQFRGVNLLPNGEYADASVSVAGSEIKLPTAGGKTVLQLPLTGGLNGDRDDDSFRGPLTTRIDFVWPRNNISRRWFLELLPYRVKSVSVRFAPKIEGRIPKHKTQTFQTRQDGKGQREETHVITNDNDHRIDRCSYSEISVINKAQVRNVSQSAGSCSFVLWAKGNYGKNSRITIRATAHQSRKEEVQGQYQVEQRRVSGPGGSISFSYNSPELVPPGFSIKAGTMDFILEYIDNEGRSIVLTDERPAHPDVGTVVSSDDGLVLTFN
jgi:hypothetical protein